jgi:predicted transcriptional regulator
MEKIKIGRNSFINIAKDKFKLLGEKPKERIDYNKWVEFINNHNDDFIWYEDTEQGKRVKERIDEFSEKAKKAVLYSLDKTNAYSTKKIAKNPSDLVVTYSTNEEMITINIEKKMTKDVAEILLEMAKFVDGKLIIGGNKELENIEQLG